MVEEEGKGGRTNVHPYTVTFLPFYLFTFKMFFHSA